MIDRALDLEPNKTEAKNPSRYISPCITNDHIKVDDGIFLTEEMPKELRELAPKRDLLVKIGTLQSLSL